MLAKIIGMILITAASSMCGAAASAGLSERKKRIRLIMLMTEKTASLIEYRALRTSEILRSLAEDAAFSDLGFISRAADDLGSGMSFADAWKNGVESDAVLSDEERRYLLRLGGFLGKSGVRGQLSLLEIHRNEAESMLEAAGREYDEKGKLYRSFGVLAGAFISVMLV